MAEGQKSLPKWMLIVSGLFAVLELMVSVSLFFSPEWVLEAVDRDAKGVNYLIYMWATRQFAFGFILAFASIKRSVPMLTIAYIFFLVMMAGDLVVGMILGDNSLVIGGLIMSIIAAGLLIAINKRKAGL